MENIVHHKASFNNQTLSKIHQYMQSVTGTHSINGVPDAHTEAPNATFEERIVVTLSSPRGQE